MNERNDDEDKEAVGEESLDADAMEEENRRLKEYLRKIQEDNS
jgi:dynactin complex subunit